MGIQTYARRAGRMVLTAVLLAGVGARPDVLAQPQRDARWALDNVQVVDTRTGRIARNRTILIDGGRIVSVGARSSGGDVRRVDGRGAFVVPGYNDMHAHPLNDPDPRDNLALMLANGVTGFRQMSGTPPMLAVARAGRFNMPDAPRLLALPGLVMTPGVAGTPEAAMAQVRSQREAGADFIKVGVMSPTAFFALLAEARRLGIPVVGHLPDGADVREAAARGMRAIEHLGPNENLFLSCSRDEAVIRRDMAAAPPPRAPVSLDLTDINALERTLANPAMVRAELGFALMRQVVDSFDPARCRQVAALLVRHQLWQVPTLIRSRTIEYGDDPLYRRDPNLRFVPARRRALWEDIAVSMPTRLAPVDRESLERLFARQMEAVRLFDRAGVPMLAGSDQGGGWIVPGFGLHQEFDLLAEAGISPLHILQMTTLNAARFLGREQQMGIVAAGRDADLVLLSANPLANARNLHRIAGVVRAGRYLDRAALDALLVQVERNVAAAANPARP